MKKNKNFSAWRPLALGALMMVIGAAGCDNEVTTTPMGPQAELVVSFTPNPVAFSAPGEWLYLITVTEVNGVGVYIRRYTAQRYSAAGTKYALDEYEVEEFRTWFDECGGEGNYIPGGTSRCGSVISFRGRNSGHQDWTFYGEDVNGNEVIATARIDFL